MSLLNIYYSYFSTSLLFRLGDPFFSTFDVFDLPIYLNALSFELFNK